MFVCGILDVLSHFFVILCCKCYMKTMQSHHHLDRARVHDENLSSNTTHSNSKTTTTTSAYIYNKQIKLMALAKRNNNETTIKDKYQ